MQHPFRVFEFDTVESTNNYAAKGLKEGRFKAFDVIMAHNQTNGRGQSGNSWQVLPKQNVTASIILQNAFLKPTHLFDYNRLISLAIYHVLCELNSECEVRIKWPNDILVYGRKLAGILIDVLGIGPGAHLIIGFGINVNQTQFSEGINGIGMKAIFGKDFSTTWVLNRVLQHLNTAIFMYQSKGRFAIQGAYNDELLGLNQEWLFRKNGEELIAQVAAVTDDGQLVLKSKSGQQSCFNPKELEWLRPWP